MFTNKAQYVINKDVTRRARGHDAPGAESLGAPKSPNNVASTFFNKVHLLLKDLGFKHEVAKLISCPEWRLTSVRTW